MKFKPATLPSHIDSLQTKKQITPDSYQSVKTPTGNMNISIPEITALDLVRYVKSAGHLNLVATILSELQEKFDIERLSHILESENIELANIQQFGYLLELVNANKKMARLEIYSDTRSALGTFTRSRSNSPVVLGSKNFSINGSMP